MPCCGKARNKLRTTTPGTRPDQVSNATPVHVKTPAATGQSVYFKYVGTTGISVTGPASSRVYRFAPNGSAIAVDPRDAAALARVPNLRAIRQA